MPNKLKKTLIGAAITVALAAAVSYGLISQNTADQIQTKANQTLNGDQTASPQQSAPANPGAQPPDAQTQSPASALDGGASQSPPPAQRP